MSDPIILVENIFSRTDLTSLVVTDPSGTNPERLRDSKDYLTYASDGVATTYKAALSGTEALEMNCLAIVNHNLDSSGVNTFRLQYSDNDAAWSDSGLGSITPTTDKIIMRPFDNAGVHKYWRLNFTTIQNTARIGEILLGRRIVFPYSVEPFGFDPLADEVVNRAIGDENGFIVETVSDYVRRVPTWNFRLMPWGTFVGDDTEWTGFKWWWDNYGSQAKPGAFHWNPGAPGVFESDALWGIVRGNISRPLASSVDQGYRDLSFSILGRKE